MATGLIAGVDQNGNVQEFDVATYIALYPGAIIKQFTAPFSFGFNGEVLSWDTGDNVVVDTPLLNALTLAGAPIV